MCARYYITTMLSLFSSTMENFKPKYLLAGKVFGDEDADTVS